MDKEVDSPLVVAFVADLMFTTRIQNVIRDLDYRIQWVGEASELEGEEDDEVVTPGERLSGQTGHLFQLITAWQPALLLFDLSNSAVPWQRWIPVLKSSAATRRIPILTYGPHTNVELMKEAARVGADAVLARSRFTADMPSLFQKYSRIPDHESIATACQNPLAPLARSGIAKFNIGEYYASHDDLEEAWRQDEGSARALYRGILQVGIAYYQIEKGNYRGAVKMLLRVRQWLDPLPAVCRSVNVAQLQVDSTAVYEALVSGGPDRIGEFDRGLLKSVLMTVA